MKKLNWFETTLKHHWIHQRIKFQTVFPYSVVSPLNNLMLFLKLISGRLLAHHQRNHAPLTRSLHGYSNNAKTNWFCTWPYFIYYVHNHSWEHYSKTWVELSSLRGRYSVVYFLPTRCISIKGDSNILSWSLYQGHKDMDDQQPFETEWWQHRTDRDHHS